MDHPFRFDLNHPLHRCCFLDPSKMATHLTPVRQNPAAANMRMVLCVAEPVGIALGLNNFQSANRSRGGEASSRRNSNLRDGTAFRAVVIFITHTLPITGADTTARDTIRTSGTAADLQPGQLWPFFRITNVSIPLGALGAIRGQGRGVSASDGPRIEPDLEKQIRGALSKPDKPVAQ